MTPRQIDKRFDVEHGFLVRTVVLNDGHTYCHRCSLDTLTRVAYCVEQHGKDGVTTNMLWQELTSHAQTQISVALDFLKERGCVVNPSVVGADSGRRVFPGSPCVVEDALIEFHALREGSPGSRDGNAANDSESSPEGGE